MSREVGRGGWSEGGWAGGGRGALTPAYKFSVLESQILHGLLQGLKKLLEACSRCVPSAISTQKKQNRRQDVGRDRLSRNHPGYCQHQNWTVPPPTSGMVTPCTDAQAFSGLLGICSGVQVREQRPA